MGRFVAVVALLAMLDGGCSSDGGGGDGAAGPLDAAADLAPGGAGAACLHGSDCQSGVCTNNACVAPTSGCSDGTKDGSETDVDCGGGTCPPCAVGKACVTGSDCASGSCTNQVCATPQPLSLAFAAPVAYATAGEPWRAAATDLNGDGIVDLVATCYGGCASNASVSVLVGNGDGTFKPFVGAGASGRSAGFAVGDFDGDKRVDIAACDYSATAWFLRGKGDGSFAAQSPVPVGMECTTVAALDVNRDGKLDLETLQSNGVSGGTATTLLGNGDGTFNPGAAIPFDAQLGVPVVLATGDLDGDGFLDVLAGVNTDNAVTGTVVAFLARPTGLAKVSQSAFAGGLWDIATADVNGDGVTDVVAGGRGAPMGSAFIRGFGGGTLSGSPVTFAGSYGGHVADFDRDGKLDVAAVGPQGTILVERGDGSGDFATAFMIALGGAPFELVTADFDRDGKPDIAAFDTTSGRVSILLNRSK